MNDPFERAVAREKLAHRERVSRYVAAGLRWHATVYLAVNALLVLIWAATGAGYFWPVWPIAGWGIGLVFHWFHTRRHLASDRVLRDRIERGDALE